MNITELLQQYRERRDSRPHWDEYFSAIATVVASRSTCGRRAVGAVLVDKNKRIIGTGYNGVARGLEHCTRIACPGALHKSGEGLDECEAIHAEANALVNCTDHMAIETIYCTSAPCIGCTKLLMNTTCNRIVFIEDYPKNGRLLWEKLGREWEKLHG